jgi:hypothetical protein
MKLDELRTALREPPPEPLTVSLDAVLAAGRHRRIRRRVGVTLTAAGATVAVVLGVPAVVASRPGGAGPVHAPVAGPGSVGAPPPAPKATGRPSADSPPPLAPRGYDPRVGALIRTGEQVQGGERVFWFERYNEPELPNNHLALKAGRRDTAGRLTLDVTANEFDGPDLAPGFHAIWLGEPAVGSTWIVLGYYVGPAARITTTIRGQQVVARTARLSTNRNVQVFWFAPETGAPDPGERRPLHLGALHAFDAAGHRLPDGHNAISVG